MQLYYFDLILPRDAEIYATNFVTEQGRDCINMNSGPGVEIIPILYSDYWLAPTNGQLSSLDAQFDERELCSAICLVWWVDWPDFISQILLPLSAALKMEIQEDSSQGNGAIQDIFEERFERHHLLLTDKNESNDLFAYQ